MKYCQGDCHRPVHEYYIMPDKMILCYECWKRGLERAELSAQTAKAKFDQSWRELKCAKEDFARTEEQIRSLREQIRDEMRMAGEEYPESHPYPNNIEDYADPKYIPYNYARVKSMERDLRMLCKKRDALEPRTHSFPSLPASYVPYYREGVYYDSARAKEYEQAEQDAIKKEQEEKERKEKERLEQAKKENERFDRINKGQITKDDFPFIEENPNDYLTKITNKSALQTIARESENNEVLAYLMNSESEELLIALSDNPALSAQDLSLLYDKGIIVLKKHIEQSALFHDLQKYRFLRLEEKGGEVDSSYLPLIEEMYAGDACLISDYHNERWAPEKIRATDYCMTTLVKNTKNQSCWMRILKEAYGWRLVFLENPNLTEEYIEILANDKSVTVLDALINNPRFSSSSKQIAKQNLKIIRDKRHPPVASSSGCCIWLILFVSISLIAACSLF